MKLPIPRPAGIGARLRRSCASGIGLALAVSMTMPAFAQTSSNAPPIPERQADGSWRYYPATPKAPADAPNVLLVLTDDVGFAATSTYGGPIPTPQFDRVAQVGLRYTQFHTTAMCSPTRAALLTGRNHHAVGSGSIANVSVDEPGYTSVIPDSAATLGRVLRDNGYVTSWFGKNHNIPDWETGPTGPYKHWPIGMGFEYFYGFNGAAADQVNPALVENINPVRRDPNDTDYWFDKDMTDHALDWLGAVKGQQPDKPFFMYIAPGTMHGPQQAPKEWVDKFKGKFDMGWDAMRDQILARQKKMGIVPEDTKMAGPLRDVPRWNSLSADQKKLYTRMMEVAAAQMAYFDFQFGRILDRLEETGELDNTLIVYVQGDNGAALHNMDGSINAFAAFAGIFENSEELMDEYDNLGTERSFGNYPVGWAYALNTPLPWGKTVASHLGGLRDGMVISWPKKIADKGGIRTQFSHVIDIAPTIYNAIGITPPETVDGVDQQPIDGIAMNYTFDNANAPTRHREQYFEMLGSRSFYKDGWIAGTGVTWDPWGANKTDPLSLPWELYNLNNDWAQTTNVAAQYPEKLAELQAGFAEAAKEYNVYPLSSDFFSRIDQKYRPNGLTGGDTHTFFPSDFRYPSVTFPELSSDWNAVAEVVVNDAGDSGPILVQGSKFAGYMLELRNGVPTFVYNPSGREEERHILSAGSTLSPGKHTLAARITPAGQVQEISLLVDGTVIDTAPIERIIKIVTGDALIGRPAIDDRTGPRECECTVEKVTITSR